MSLPTLCGLGLCLGPGEQECSLRYQFTGDWTPEVGVEALGLVVAGFDSTARTVDVMWASDWRAAHEKQKVNRP